MKKQILFSITVFLGLLISCKPTQQKELDLSQVRNIIETQNAKWLTAIEHYDINTLLSLYTDDAILLPPNRPMLRGKREIKTYYERMQSRGIKIIKPIITTFELSGKDNTVYEIGQYIINIERQGKFTVSDTGKYSTIWKLQSDSSWIMYADCWNSNNPLRFVSSDK